MESGETLRIDADLFNGASGDWTLSAMVPFLADRLRADAGRLVDTNQSSLYVGSALAAMPALGNSVTLRLVADDDGVIDLSSLQLNGGLDSAGSAYRENTVDSLVITSIVLPSGEELVTGGPKNAGLTFTAPGSGFSSVGRAHGWVHLGQAAVSEEDAILVTVQSRANPGGGVNVVTSVGARFYPTAS